MSELNDTKGFLDFFASVPDHRVNRKKLYSVGELLLLTLCGLVSGCNSWEDLEFFWSFEARISSLISSI